MCDTFIFVNIKMLGNFCKAFFRIFSNNEISKINYSKATCKEFGGIMKRVQFFLK